MRCNKEKTFHVPSLEMNDRNADAWCYFAPPHPLVLLPEVGGGRERKIAATGNTMETAAREVAR